MLWLIWMPLLIPLLGLGWLLRRRQWRGLAEGAVLGLLVMGAGVWAVFQSRSSTGALGLLPLPFYASLAALLGWAGGRGWRSPRRWQRGLAVLALGVALLLPVLLLADGLRTRARNQAFDAQMAAQRAEIERHRAAIRARLAQHPGAEGEQLEALSREHADDRAGCCPCWSSPICRCRPWSAWRRRRTAVCCWPPSVTRARRPPCWSGSTASSWPDYFFSDLARHPNTPPALLAELYRRPRSIQHLDRQFAANPALPAELRRELLAQTRDVHVVQGLLGLPTLDCALLPALRQALARSKRPDDEYSQRQLQALSAGPCAPAQAGG